MKTNKTFASGVLIGSRFSTPEILLYLSLQHPLHTWIVSDLSLIQVFPWPKLLSCLTSLILRELVFPTWYYRSYFKFSTFRVQYILYTVLNSSSFPVIYYNECRWDKVKWSRTAWAFFPQYILDGFVVSKWAPQYTTKQFVVLLKGVCHEIFDLQFFSRFEPIWAPDKQTKVFSNLVKILPRNSNF